MSRALNVKNYFTFNKGFNTEAGYLTFPENTAVDMSNMNINADSSLSRRNGIDYETSYSFNDVNSSLSTPVITLASSVGTSWVEGVLSNDGSTIYGIPHTATSLLKINVSTGAYTTTGSVTAGSNKWAGGAITSGGIIYCTPVDQTSALKIDTSNDTTTTLSLGLSGTNNLWGAVLAANGKIYMFPSSDNYGVVINPADDTYATLTGTSTTSAKRFRCGVEYNSNIYCPAYQGADQILKINTSTNAQSLLTGETTGVTDMWTGAILSSKTNKIYCIPADATFVQVIDPATDTTSQLGSGLTGADKWYGGYEDDNGIIWGVPATSKSLLKIDPVNGTVETIDESSSLNAGATSYYGGVYANSRGYYMMYQDPAPAYATHIISSASEGFTNRQCNRFIWDNPGNDPDLEFAVFQIGNIIKFHDLKASGSTSANEKSFTIDLDSYISSHALKAGESVVDFDASNGVLYICGADIHPIYVTYDASADSITVTQLSVYKRDRDGIEDSLDVDSRPTSLTNAHKYNLRNQGWSDTNINAYFASTGYYPSNAQIWYQGKDANEDFDPTLLDKQDFGTTLAPQGRYILDAFDPDRSSTSGISGLSNIDSSTTLPASLAIHAGRMVMFNDGRLFISRVISKPADAGKFYSSADPSAEIDNAIADDDGFILNLPEVGEALAILSIETGILVFSRLGVWNIAPTSGAIFSPSNVEVNKLKSPGITGTLKNVINTEHGVFYMSDAGLYIITPDTITGKNNGQNISLNTIQSFLISDISAASRKYAFMDYDKGVKQLHIFFNTDTTYDGADFRSAYDGILTFDIRKEAFFKHAISRASTSPYIYISFPLPNLKSQTVSDTVTVAGDTVTANGVTVVVDKTVTALGSTSLQYLVAKNTGTNYQYTFADFTDTTFVDWNTDADQAYSSYVITGYEIAGDASRRKDAPYLVMHFKRVEGSIVSVTSGVPTFDIEGSCQVQYRWNWSDSAASNQWGTAFEAYRRNHYTTLAVGTFDDGYPVVSSQSKLRGSGAALSLKMSSSTGKDMQIIGWSLLIGSTTVPGTRGNP